MLLVGHSLIVADAADPLPPERDHPLIGMTAIPLCGMSGITWWDTRMVIDATDSLLSRFAGKLESSGYVVLPRTRDDEVEVIKDGHRLCLLFSKRKLQRSLRHGQGDASIVWGPGVTAEESLARFMTIHLEESLATAAEENIDGRWRYSKGFFVR